MPGPARHPLPLWDARVRSFLTRRAQGTATFVPAHWLTFTGKRRCARCGCVLGRVPRGLGVPTCPTCEPHVRAVVATIEKE